MAQLTYQHYILLPKTETRLSAPQLQSETQATFAKLTVNTHLNDVLNTDLADQAIVLDSTSQTGTKLISIPEIALPALRAELAGLRIVPEVFYYPQIWRPEVRQKPSALAAQPRVSVRIQLKDAKSGKPIIGATAVAFTDFEQRAGEQGTSNSQGIVTFKSIGNRIIDQLYIYPKAGYWSFWKQNLTLKNNDTFAIQPIKLDYQDARNFFYPPTTDSMPAGQGVKVAVIDTGAGPHPDLTIAGGGCTVTGEDPTDFADVDEHGTHVSGIIAAHGTPPTGVRGVAPHAELHVYRVFGKGSEGASNFAIVKAIEQAVADGCDLVNMSLGGGPPDEATQQAITFAHDHGTLCFVATGNDGRQPVSFPASFSLSLAVGAMGRKGTFPANTTDSPNTAAPYGIDKKNFVAAFSNIGPEVDFIAPGVGIISSVPDGYAPLSGTSMACPMATGVAARLLSSQLDILNMPRNASRSEAMIRFLATNVQLLGFGATFEGTGMLFTS
ncbi:S8 family serine peptidase [Spirosoma sp. SC4-14]|uniref:S8 family serine peptidase n=1 Tax=Spirosoma sp. SC4-14 TaxID=3128900 RepID=UPI0030D60C68